MRYVKNEWMKLWAQRNAWIMLILACLLIITAASLFKYYDEPQATAEQRQAANQQEVDSYKELLQQEDLLEEDIAYYEEQLQLAQYRVDHDLPVAYASSFSSFMESMAQMVIVLSTTYMTIIAAGIVSSEFSTGTIKMLLTRPVARWKIVLSKLTVVFLYGLTIAVVMLSLSALVSVILWGTDASILLTIENGQIVESIDSGAFVDYLLYASVGAITSTLFAFMLGTVFSSSALAVGLSLIILMMGNTILLLLSRFEFSKFLWFANGLTQYMGEPSPYMEGMTLTFSLIVNIAYMIIFLAITLLHFTKRDVTA